MDRMYLFACVLLAGLAYASAKKNKCYVCSYTDGQFDDKCKGKTETCDGKCKTEEEGDKVKKSCSKSCTEGEKKSKEKTKETKCCNEDLCNTGSVTSYAVMPIILTAAMAVLFK